MNILISGAGPAGLSLAYWLQKYGYKPTIVEAAKELRTAGYKIDIRGVALDVIQKMGIEAQVLAANTDMQGARLIDKNGNIINEMAGDAFGHRTGHDQEIMRGKLCHILLDQIPNVEIIYDDVIQKISQTARQVHVEFKKNAARTFDLVIGADGLHSTVRRLIFGEESNFSKNSGIYLCVYTIPNFLNLDRMEIQYTELGRVAAVWSTRGESASRASFAFVSDAKLNHHDVPAQQQLVRTVFREMRWEFPKILGMMSQASDFYFDEASQIWMDHWSKGRVALTGDAAYCASPMSGQGLSLALVGPYVLAGELAKAKGDYNVAFKQYEIEMRPYIKLNQALGITSAKIFRSQENNNVLSWFFVKIMKLVPGFMIKYFIDRATARIQKAARGIELKDYSNQGSGLTK